MTHIYMVTQNNPTKGSLKFLSDFYQGYDGKRYCIAIEHGRRGTRHAQIRIEFSGDPLLEYTSIDGERKKIDHFFEACRMFKAHCEKSENWIPYEKKEGYYITDQDNEEIRMQRFGELTEAQEGLIREARGQNDREVTVWYDEEGNHGKSWLVSAMWERGKAHRVRATGSCDKMINDVASKIIKEGKREFLFIDIPRASKWKPEMYEAIEIIKDGLIDDPRYQSQEINIKGTKIVILTNNMPKLDKLSKDRWKFYTR